ncbi:MAG: homoserine O-acetyltransferase [Candidatus Margulisbacteria bacterium]|nr:homoserine O-acetyltransferase [Candidatus Margulisiibacteriota bacterium]
MVETKYFEFPELNLESGGRLGPVTVAYETYGSLNDAKSNTILIFHALSGDAHVAGRHAVEDKKPGWWDNMVGPGKAFDTNKYYIICANVLGGCRGTTGPSSLNPKTGKPYGPDFPLITIKDMVNCQLKLLDYLGIETVLAATGGSMGGMLALQLAVSAPNRVRNVIGVATSAHVSAQNIAFNEVGRRAIIGDPHWYGGSYYDKNPPSDGLSIARMIGHITYLSDKTMREKFGRKLQPGKGFAAKFGDHQFEVESYLKYKGTTFTERFDANSYLYITKAIDLFNLEDEGGGSLAKALAKATSRFLLIHFSSDWLFPEYQALELVDALKDNLANVSFRVIESNYGHDAFLLEEEELTKTIVSFLEGAK